VNKGGWNNRTGNKGGWNNCPRNKGGWNNRTGNKGGWNNRTGNKGGWNNRTGNTGCWNQYGEHAASLGTARQITVSQALHGTDVRETFVKVNGVSHKGYVYCRLWWNIVKKS
jgi:hypothetical protein